MYAKHVNMPGHMLSICPAYALTNLCMVGICWACMATQAYARHMHRQKCSKLPQIWHMPLYTCICLAYASVHVGNIEHMPVHTTWYQAYASWHPTVVSICLASCVHIHNCAHHPCAGGGGGICRCICLGISVSRHPPYEQAAYAWHMLRHF